jgi:alkyldihydroxyacetonephosphate synthase
MSASAARLKHFGWGREGEGLSADEEAFVLARAQARFGTALTESASAPRLDEIRLAAPRIVAPASLSFCTVGHYDRAAHTYGKSYPELARGLARDYASAPDVVAYPRNERDVAAVLDWAGSADASVAPFGGGSSVVGGVEPRRYGHQGAVTIDLREMGKVKEVDKTSRAALIEGGTYGPALEAQLRPHGLTLRHFPQSFEYSTLGGWIATRSGGHFATLYTHIDDFVESLRTITPKGVIESSIRPRLTTPAPPTARWPSWSWRSSRRTMRSNRG